MTEERAEYKPKPRRGGYQIPGPGKKTGRPKGTTKPETKRISKTFKLTPEVVRLLGQEENQAALIEGLLRKHYGL